MPHNEKQNIEIVKLTIATIHQMMTENPEYRKVLKTVSYTHLHQAGESCLFPLHPGSDRIKNGRSIIFQRFSRAAQMVDEKRHVV